jgi:hypothetical protein
MALPKYFIGAGDVKFAKLDPATGLPLAFVDIGEAPAVKWDETVEYADAFSSGKSGPNLQNLHQAIKRSAALEIMCTEKLAATLEQFYHGTKTAEVAGSYTANEAFPTGIVVGESYLVPGGHVGITALVIKDSAVTPVALTLGTHYTFTEAGLVTFLSLGSFTQPFKAFSYSYKASTILKIANATPGDVCVLFDGVNLVTNDKTWARFDRVSFAPVGMALKDGSSAGTSNTPETFDLKGVGLLGLGKTATDGYGEYREY